MKPNQLSMKNIEAMCQLLCCTPNDLLKITDD
ncbi:MAG: helix-turn-helix domain-containing protein [Anaerotruncus sp.]|nr:MAG: helix-turn-helix domain-containing protein [Anaerotruncus sp.]